MKSLAICALMGALGVGGTSQAEAEEIIGAGTEPCSFFLSEISAARNPNGTPRDSEAIYFAWLQGYISEHNAAAEINGERPLPSLEPYEFRAEQQKIFVRDYCRKNPDKLYVDAAEAVWSKLQAFSGGTV